MGHYTRWGPKDAPADVTDICQRAVSGDSMTIPISDEAFAHVKSWQPTFTITYLMGDDVKTSKGDGPVFQIGTKITSFVKPGKGLLNTAATIAELRKAHPNGLLILDARYGSKENSKDVTDACQTFVVGDSATIPTSPKAFSQEAIWQADFNLVYTNGKELKALHSGENEIVQIGPNITAFMRAGGAAGTVEKSLADLRQKFGDGLLILNASYGDGRDFQDVTALLQSRVVSGKLTTTVGDRFPDPAQGRVKHADLTYWDGTAAKFVSLKEGQSLNLAASLPDDLKSIAALPSFIAAGKAFTHNFGAPGTYTLAQGPPGATLTQGGGLSWTPTDAQAGAQEFKLSVRINGKSYLQTFRTEVVTAAAVAAVGGDLKKFQTLTRLDLAAGEHTFDTDFDHKDALVLAKDQLSILDADGITIKKTLKLGKPYIRIAERDTYFVAIRNDPLAMDLLDKQTGKSTKTVKLDYRNFHDLALLPNRPISFVTAAIADSVPHDRIVVINEETGDVREPKDLMGTFMRIDHSGQHMWVGLKDIYQNGSDFHINPDFNIVEFPTYGNIDYLLRYDLIDGGLVLKDHLDAAGGNGSGIRISPDGKRVTYLSFTGFPMYSKNLAAWAGEDFEKKPVVYNIKDATAGQGSQCFEFHPVLPLVLIPKPEGVIIFGRDSGDEEPERTKIATGALAGVSINNAKFSPDGLAIILDCQQGDKLFLFRIPLILTEGEKALIKKGLPDNPAPKAVDGPIPGMQRG